MTDSSPCTSSLPETTRSPRRRKNPHPESDASLQRHSRKCQVCSHRDREAIEWAFVHWRRPRAIASAYGLSDDSLHRHAMAFDLYSRRSDNLRSVLDHVLERGVETDITGDTILRAVRAYTCLTHDNRWIEPSSNVVFSARPSLESPAHLPALPASLTPALPPAAAPEIAGLVSNRGAQELENDLSR